MVSVFVDKRDRSSLYDIRDTVMFIDPSYKTRVVFCASKRTSSTTRRLLKSKSYLKTNSQTMQFTKPTRAIFFAAVAILVVSLQLTAASPQNNEGDILEEEGMRF